MARITWSDLQAIYAVAEFGGEGTGTLKIVSQQVLDALLLVDHDDDEAREAGLGVLSERNQLEMGRTVELRFDTPRLALGRFVPSFATLIAGPSARVEEPKHYFIADIRITERTAPPSDLQVRYRATLALVDLLKQAAAYLDTVQQELVFFRDGRISVPVDYDIDDLAGLDKNGLDSLLRNFTDPIHMEQKLSILSEAVIDVVAGLPAGKRFRHVLREAKDIADRVASGYRLFASSFSYSKIRREVESAQTDFLVRIHKTFVDIQGQVLGIPIATVVVASQLKAAPSCGVEVWTNLAVVSGAWLFVLFLIASLINQSLTLDAIEFEFKRQQARLLGDFSEVGSSFNDAFVRLGRRSFWHRAVFVVIAAIGIGGATFATVVSRNLTGIDVTTCL